MFEVYDYKLRRDIHNFYNNHNLKVWLPAELGGRILEYIVEFDSGYYMITVSYSAPIFRKIG